MPLWMILFHSWTASSPRRFTVRGFAFITFLRVCVASLAETDELARQKIGEMGGVAIVVRTLKKMKEVPHIVMTALFALRFLLFEDLNRELLDKCQGIDAVTECLKYYNSLVHWWRPLKIT